MLLTSDTSFDLPSAKSSTSIIAATTLAIASQTNFNHKWQNTNFDIPKLYHSDLIPQDALNFDISINQIIFSKFTNITKKMPARFDSAKSLERALIAVRQSNEFFEKTVLNKQLKFLPHITLTSEDEINTFWKEKDFRLDINFPGDNTYYLYFSTVDGIELSIDSRPHGVSLPDIILETITS